LLWVWSSGVGPSDLVFFFFFFLQANQHLAQQSKSYKLPYRMYLKPLK